MPQEGGHVVRFMHHDVSSVGDATSAGAALVSSGRAQDILCTNLCLWSRWAQ